MREDASDVPRLRPIVSFRSTVWVGRKVLKSRGCSTLFKYRLTNYSKRDGLDKAVHRIEEAIKKSRTQNADHDTFHLQNLLNEAQVLGPRKLEFGSGIVKNHANILDRHISPQTRGHQPVIQSQLADDNYAVDDAENPLQLLARASDLSIPSHQAYPINIVSAATRPPRLDMEQAQDLQSFFGPFRPNLDIGEDIDPIAMGLVTIEEAEMLFTL